MDFSIRISPFGNLRINGYLLLPAAYRSLSRPSSAPSVKAFALRSSMLDHVLHNLSFSELVMRESLLLHSTNIVVYPNILLFMGFTLLYLIRSFRCSIFKVRFEWVSSVL